MNYTRARQNPCPPASAVACCDAAPAASRLPFILPTPCLLTELRWRGVDYPRLRRSPFGSPLSRRSFAGPGPARSNLVVRIHSTVAPPGSLVAAPDQVARFLVEGGGLLAPSALALRVAAIAALLRRPRACSVEPCGSNPLYRRSTGLTRCCSRPSRPFLGGGGWIRTTEARASDLQSDPFGHSGTPPKGGTLSGSRQTLSTRFCADTGSGPVSGRAAAQRRPTGGWERWRPAYALPHGGQRRRITRLRADQRDR